MKSKTVVDIINGTVSAVGVYILWQIFGHEVGVGIALIVFALLKQN